MRAVDALIKKPIKNHNIMATKKAKSKKPIVRAGVNCSLAGKKLEEGKTIGGKNARKCRTLKESKHRKVK